MNSFSLDDVKITDGFIKDKTEIDQKTTIYSIYKRFEQTNRFEALKCTENVRADIFWLSDVAKWLEACAYILGKKEDKTLWKYFDDAVHDIIENQREDGYYNPYFQVFEPDNIFKRRTDHELYCAGHLFEAAVAAYVSLHDDRLLKFSERYCKYIRRRFIEQKDTGFVTPGHEEIELALYKLYKLTKNGLYKELGEFFLFSRGEQAEDSYDFAPPEYNQSHLPVREQKTAVGHAVRALYLYIAMADWARENGDENLKDACRELFRDMTERKMYITGGLGSSACMEAFTIPYDLPNNTAYSETCASIAMAMFCDRMIKMERRAVYGDIFERVLYNAFFAGVSHDGKSFFYVNPLSVDIEKTSYHEEQRWREVLPLAERKEIFDCSCCPPNVSRFIEILPENIYYAEDDSLVVFQYISSDLRTEDVEIRMQSEFPYDGKVTVKILKNRKFRNFKFRKPLWSDKISCNCQYTTEGNFIIIRAGEGDIVFDFGMTLKEIYCNPAVSENIRKKAYCYGPLVMCAEGIDNQYNFQSARPILQGYRVVPGEFFKIMLKASVLDIGEELYTYAPPKETEKELILIPYFEWANRGRNSMRVWFYA